MGRRSAGLAIALGTGFGRRDDNKSLISPAEMLAAAFAECVGGDGTQCGIEEVNVGERGWVIPELPATFCGDSVL